MAGRARFDRDEALETALYAFWARGFEQTSITQLTEAMGINPPSLYAAFGSKDRLFVEASNRYVERFRQGVLAALEIEDTRAAIEALLLAAARAHTRPSSPAGCLIMSEPRLQLERQQMTAQIADRLRAGQQRGGLAWDADPEDLAAFIEAVLAGMSSRARDGASYAKLVSLAAVALAALPGPKGKPECGS